MSQAQASVLLVERDDLLRDCIAGCLARSGYAVWPAPGAQAALDRLQSGSARPQAVLLDLFLPLVWPGQIMNGLMLLDLMRRLPGMESVPVIVLSTLGFPEIVQQAKSAGARDFVLKPFDPQVLATKLNALTEVRQN